MGDKSLVVNVSKEGPNDEVANTEIISEVIVTVDKGIEGSRNKVEKVGVLEEAEKEKSDDKEIESKSTEIHHRSNKTALYFERGKYEIPQEHKKELEHKIEEICVGEYANIGTIAKKTASFFKGHKVASEKDYKCGTASFSTRTSLIEIDGSKYFVIYNYPGSASHRKPDTNCRKAWGEKALKASEEDWRDTFLSRSLIPAYKSENPRVVVLPFIKNISLIDLLEKYNSDNFHGDYEYGKQFDDFEVRLILAHDVSASLGDLHQRGVTWGEVIPANIGRTVDGKIIFFDPETPYIEGTPEIEQKARDLLSLCVSTCTAFFRSNTNEGRDTDYNIIVSSVLSAYPDKEVIKFIQENLCKELDVAKTLKHPIAFGQFKARLAVNSRGQYNEILQAIRELRS